MNNKTAYGALLALVIMAGCVQPGAQGTSAANVYVKDQTDVDAKAVTTTITKVELKDLNGEMHTVFEGSSEVKLQEGVLQQVASSDVNAGTYTHIVIQFGDTATVEDANGTITTAEIVRKQIVVNIPRDKPEEETTDANETINVVVDFSLEGAVMLLPNGKVNFTPDHDAKAETWAEAGIEIDSSINAQTKAKVVVDTEIVNHITSETALGAGLKIGLGG